MDWILQHHSGRSVTGGSPLGGWAFTCVLTPDLDFLVPCCPRLRAQRLLHTLCSFRLLCLCLHNSLLQKYFYCGIFPFSLTICSCYSTSISLLSTCCRQTLCQGVGEWGE